MSTVWHPHAKPPSPGRSREPGGDFRQRQHSHLPTPGRILPACGLLLGGKRKRATHAATALGPGSGTKTKWLSLSRMKEKDVGMGVIRRGPSYQI